ncbi:MAG: DUF305 domain-containing protein [Deinococcota bacterium]|jgi:uncharacterized protein (DUF305 family)|nr:DUF305 domain-containing protein [Deinococcota bacterium]
MKEPKRITAILMLALVAAAFSQGMDHSQMGHGGADSPLADLEGEAFEVGFLSMMIVHHQGAVEMSEWILERTERPELRETAEAIIASQEAEIEMMSEWLQGYEQDSDPEMVETMPEMMRSDNDMMMQEMMAYEDADIGFLTMMTEHHQGAIDMAQLALTRATRAELRTLSRDIITQQAEEIHDFQEWLASWH